MEELRLYWPAKPYKVHQVWGIRNPLYEQFGFKRHNGEDFALGADTRLYAPCSGTIVRTGNQPNGGGIFLSVMSEHYQFPDGQYRVLIDLLHCEKLLVSEGAQVTVGDVVAIADNTGLSTGPHTHIQVRRVHSWNGESGTSLFFKEADSNDANNSIDPSPYWQSVYAQDYWKAISLLQQLVALLQKMLNLSSKSASAL
jgi:murein DD-endopeptidase MepM/ murein hydrolase activator NlpD